MWSPTSLHVVLSLLSFSISTLAAQEWSEGPLQNTTIQLPLFYGQNDTATIPILYKRMLAKSQPAKQVIWLLQGGPGAASSFLEHVLLKLYNVFDGEVDMYTIDHRGVGGSSCLNCTTMEDRRMCIEKLIDNGQDPRAYTTTNAAKDLHVGIEKFNQNQDVYLFGTSYGSYYAERYLTIYPNMVKGAILDGVVSQPGPDMKTFFDLADWTYNHDSTSRYLFQFCRENPLCSQKLQDPETLLRDLYKTFDTGHCSSALEGVDYDTPATCLQEILSGLLRSDPIALLDTIYRLNRCSGKDVEKMNSLFHRQITANKESEDMYNGRNINFSPLLQDVVAYSEIFAQPTPSQEEVDEAISNALVGDTALSVRSYCEMSGYQDANCQLLENAQAPSTSYLYKRDEYFSQVAPVPQDGGVMMVHGVLDPQTPIESAQNQMDIMSGKRRLFTINFVVHGVVRSSYMNNTSNLPTCGMLLIKSFLENNGDVYKVDDSCIENVTLDFARIGNDEESSNLMTAGFARENTFYSL